MNGYLVREFQWERLKWGNFRVLQVGGRIFEGVEIFDWFGSQLVCLRDIEDVRVSLLDYKWGGLLEIVEDFE